MTDQWKPTPNRKQPPPESKPPNDEQWQAILNNDARYNGHFYYAVQTTGIFCHPSCKSKPPKRENVAVFRTAEQALTLFRPCKRCKPADRLLPDEEWVAFVADYINQNYSRELKLERLADISHGSPYHLHRTFKKIKGITPAEYIRQIRMEQAKHILITLDQSVAEVGRCVGLPNTPYFITLFKKMTGRTPEDYRKGHKHVETEETPAHESK